MGPPLLIGAGLGALTSAAMGKSPFTGALLGGATGGMFGGAGGLFGAAPSAGVSGLATLPEVAPVAGEISIPSTSLLGGGTTASSVGIPASSLSGGLTNLGMEGIGSGFVPNAGVQLSSNALSNGLDYGINAGNTLAGGQSIYQAPSFMNNFNKIPTQVMDYAKENPISVLSGANTISNMSSNAAAQEQQRLNEAISKGQRQIQQGNPSMVQNYNISPSAIAASPSYGTSKEEIAKSKVAQLYNLAHLTEQDKRKNGNFYTSLIG
jgi:hypothetical protein